MRTDRVAFAPYGLAGGEPGGRSRNFMEVGNSREPLLGKVTMTVPHNAVIIHEQAGAGGVGDPGPRDPALVREDILDGKIERRLCAMALQLPVGQGRLKASVPEMDQAGAFRAVTQAPHRMP